MNFYGNPVVIDMTFDAMVTGSSVSQTPDFKVDYNLMLENIKDLNTLAGEGVASIKHTKDGARLKVSFFLP